MKVKRVLVLLSLVLSIGLVLSACGNLFGSDDSGGAGGTNNYTSANIGTLVYVPAGSFQRDAGEDNISIISQSFRMSEHQITRLQFFSIMGTDPSDHDVSTGTSDPVQQVSWYAAIAFANKLSIAEGLTPVYGVSVGGGLVIDWENLDYDDIPTDDNADWNDASANWEADGYRLPTEMEWMWAAMGADQDAQSGAMQDGINRTGYSKPFAGYDGSNSIGDYAWYRETSGHSEGDGTTHPVGTKLPNELGLYDMSGNVWEWNWDWYEDDGSWPNYAISGTVTDHRGADSGPYRVVRGGSWWDEATSNYVFFRLYWYPRTRNNFYGFRLVRP